RSPRRDRAWIWAWAWAWAGRPRRPRGPTSRSPPASGKLNTAVARTADCTHKGLGPPSPHAATVAGRERRPGPAAECVRERGDVRQGAVDTEMRRRVRIVHQLVVVGSQCAHHLSVREEELPLGSLEGLLRRRILLQHAQSEIDPDEIRE